VRLKKHRGGPLIWIGVASLLAISVFTYEFNSAVFVADVKEKIQSQDLGYSDFPGYKQILKDIGGIINGKIYGFASRPEFQRIDIDIPILELNKLLDNRKNAIANKILVDPVDVKARLRFDGSTYRAKVRLKGDLPDHWTSRYRMSLRVSLKGGNTILGFKKFSVHKPSSRQHPFDQSYSESTKLLGLLSPTHKYARIFFNGADWGVMNIEEHISKELLEKQRRKDSIVVRFGSERYGAIYTDIPEAQKYVPYRLSDPLLYLKAYDSDRYLEAPINRKRLTYIFEERLKKAHSHIYDSSKYSLAFMQALVWNDGHPLYYSNSRHYLNPYSLQLEPILSDSIAPLLISQYGLFPRNKISPFTSNEIYGQLLRTEDFKQRQLESLRVVGDSVSRTQEKLETIQSYFPLDGKLDVSEVLTRNVASLDGALDSFGELEVTPVSKVPQSDGEDVYPHVQAFHRVDGTLEIFSLVPQLVVLEGIIVGDQFISVGGEVLPYLASLRQPLILTTGLLGDQSGKLQVKTEVNGQSLVSPVEPTIGALEVILPGVSLSRHHGLPSESQANLFPEHLHLRHYKDGRIAIFNLIDDEVVLDKILIGDENWLPQPVVVPGFQYENYQQYWIQTDLTGIYDNRLRAVTRYQGMTRVSDLGETLDASDNYNPLLLADHENGYPDYVRRMSPNSWKIEAGNWHVTEPLIFHGDLEISAGTILEFDEDSYLLIKGAMEAKGRKTKPVILRAYDRNWKGVYVFRAERTSILEDLHILNTRALQDGLLSLTGGVTFYQSDVVLKNIIIDGSTAEDALNIVESDFKIENIRVRKSFSDGIDFDYARGEVDDSSFNNIDGDALDFAGSKATIRNSSFRSVKDKAISAGEESTIHISKIDASDCGIGIASKDGSKVTGDNVRLDFIALSGIMTYQKKSFYAMPSVSIDDVSMQNVRSKYSRQFGSDMRINGGFIPTTNFDVDDLYTNAIVGGNQ
jgi:hypothetical protein